jgi:ribosome-associated toxin RatA of RatAB toxin-antitoxin module
MIRHCPNRILMPIRLHLLLLLLALVALPFLAVAQEIDVTVREAGDAFIVEANFQAPVRARTAWDVLVDYEHMASIMSNLESSKIASRNGNTLIVRQTGVARFGLFSYAFQVEREIRLEPITRIHTKNLSGSLKRMESEVMLTPSSQESGVRVAYHGEFVFGSTLAGLFAQSFLRHEVEEQFQALVAEMRRRETQPLAGMQ